MREELVSQQICDTTIRPLEEYAGVYFNGVGNYRISIRVHNGKLVMRFERGKQIAYDLRHYHYDTFSWLISHDRNAVLGRFPVKRASYYLIRFEASGQTGVTIDSLIWALDDMVMEGKNFMRRSGRCCAASQRPRK